ncbi:MAG: glutamate--tRNA ligase [Pseudomonadota bacterium]
MPDVVRFAPSPTGELHIGNVRTALYNWFLAISSGGSFVLRYDDTDVERSKDSFAKQISIDLDWLGIEPGRVERQSERLARYDAAAEDLRRAGLLYPCYETPEELDRKRSRLRARGLPPVYDRAALSLSDAERHALEAEGRRPHWRFKLPAGARSWDDLCRGPQTVNLGAVSDPILVREDGSYLYTLPSVVDDIDFTVTTVVRGEDHVTNSGVQIAIFEALGASAPQFAHHNLLVRGDGEPLSKRDNPLSIRRLAQDGYEPLAVASLAVLVGTSHPVAPGESLDQLAKTVALKDVSRGPATFDPAELKRLNAAIVHALPAPATDPREALLWTTVRDNLTFRGDVNLWRERLEADADAISTASPLSGDEKVIVSEALALLPPEPWDEATFGAWTKAVRQQTGAKGKALFMPLRKALTGADSGPELGPWMRLLGHEATVARLEAAAT